MTFKQTFLAIWLGIMCVQSQGSAQISSRSTLAAIVERTPEVVVVNEGDQMRHAELKARMLGGGVLWGAGRSMEPLYAHNTALVVVEADYDKLKKGMTVVYLNEHGMRVAHCIVSEARGGYVMQGVNNAQEDSKLLTKDNFIGVVAGAFAAKPTNFFAEAKARLSPKRLGPVAKPELRTAETLALTEAEAATLVGSMERGISAMVVTDGS